MELDENGQIVEPIDPSTGIAASREEAEAAINDTGLFKLKTEYITIGDEPHGGRGVVDLKTMLKPADYDSLKQYFTFMPRSMLWDFFSKKIWPSLPWNYYTPAGPNDVLGAGMHFTHYPSPAGVLYGISYQKKSYEDMVWAAIIDLFNEANLDYVNQNQMEPWDWEQKKTDAYYVSTSKEAIEDLAKEIEAFRDVSLALDPKAREILEQFAELPKLGDVGFEINRQNALKELLKMKDYVSAQAIVDAFRYAKDTVIGEQLTKPIPYDIVSKSGVTVAKASDVSI